MNKPSDSKNVNAPIFTRNEWQFGKYGLSFIFLAWVIIGTLPWWLPRLFCSAPNAGEIGDMFGAANALFSSLAFGGALVAIYLQQKEMHQSREEAGKMLEKQSESIAATLKSTELNVQQFLASSLFDLINRELPVIEFVTVRTNLRRSFQALLNTPEDKMISLEMNNYHADDHLALAAEECHDLMAINDQQLLTNEGNKLLWDLYTKTSGFIDNLRNLATGDQRFSIMKSHRYRAQSSIQMFERFAGFINNLLIVMRNNGSPDDIKRYWNLITNDWGVVSAELAYILATYRNHCRFLARLGDPPNYLF